MKLPAVFFTTAARRLGRRCLGQAPEGRRPSLPWRALVLTGLLLAPPLGFAQIPLPPASAAAAARGVPDPLGRATAPDSSWAELTPQQQQALAPLASSWDHISQPQKRKWLEISRNYRLLTPQEQATLNSRMSEWVALSPQQRVQARLNFGKTKELSRQLTPEEKKARWEAYQALSPQEKEKLAAKASPKPSGAAPAVKPVPPQKLTGLPVDGSKPALKPAPKIMALPSAIPVSAAPAPEAASTLPQR
ncbi:MAG: DUF3106 domain-containing protein [Pseudomonadota bacterium]|nr:DUF3106 domain-containing protein [Pseudomonadota bacterium]